MPLSRKSIRLVDRRLAKVFGTPVSRRGSPVAALVGCILSQATTDAQSGAAYDALVARYPTWTQLRDARESDIARLIRSSGLANEKARYIKHALQFIERARGRITLNFLSKMPIDQARQSRLYLFSGKVPYHPCVELTPPVLRLIILSHVPCYALDDCGSG